MTLRSPVRDTESYSIRLPKSVWLRLRAWELATNRSRSNLIETVMTAAVGEWEAMQTQNGDRR